MFPAKIIEISDKVKVEYYKLQEPDHDDFKIGYEREEPIYDDDDWDQAICEYDESRTIAEVENVSLIAKKGKKHWYIETIYHDEVFELELNKPCFIEPIIHTIKGKCKIVKL